jgi:drug/metabolite transporter (DMT)-like permease
MIFLLISIVSFAAMMQIFKLLERFNVPTFQVIVFNYITASTLGFFVSGRDFSPLSIASEPWFIHAAVVGVSFISLFYLIGYTAQKAGISVATVANKMSVVIPVTLAFFLYNDKVTFLKITGIALALAGVFMATRKEEKQSKTRQNFLLPLVLFVGSGFLDSFLNYTEKSLLKYEGSTLFFTPVVFSVAGIFGISVLIAGLLAQKSRFNYRSIYWGMLLGFFNYASLYYFLESLKTGIESSVIFSVNNIGIVTLSTGAARIFFKEHLSLTNKAGVVISLIAILMIAFG